MSKPVRYGFRVRIFGPFRVAWLGSWGDPRYKRFGAWRHSGGFTVRWRAYLFMVYR